MLEPRPLLGLLSATLLMACTMRADVPEEAARVERERLPPGLADTAASRPAARWWKGNLHTHSLWSDGDDFPEMIASWYRERGYHFLAFTEHDMLQTGERWVDVEAPDAGWPPRNASARAALPGYRERYGAEWVEERRRGAAHEVRLRPLAEYRSRLEEPGRFLLLPGEEITDRNGAHVNAINVGKAIPPGGGADAAARIRANVGAVAEHAARERRSAIAIVNHPNYLWTLTAEDLAGIPDARFFEVYNGHLLVNNGGDAVRPGTDRLWDVMLALRSAAGAPPIFGVATDDAHHYPPRRDTIAGPGRGWVMVRAGALDADSIVAALRAGDFYASTGVTLRELRRGATGIRVEISAEPGVAYRTHFIGTRRADPLRGRRPPAAGDSLRTSLEYGAGVGETFAVVDGPVAEYVFRGDERYVRAKVVSSKAHVDPATGRVLGRETAWVQPVIPKNGGDRP